MAKLIVFLVLFVPMICHADSLDFTILCENHLVIESSVNSEVVDFGFFEDYRLFDRYPHFEGSIKVRNNSKKVQNFSTANVLLAGQGIEKTRAYHRSFASHIIDLPPGMKLQPGEEAVVKVYWVTSLGIGEVLKDMKLYCEYLEPD